jgi:hypothetical protein
MRIAEGDERNITDPKVGCVTVFADWLKDAVQ